MRRKRNYGGTPRRPTPVRQATGHTFLIVVEGQVTEIAYFQEIRTRLRRRAAAVVVWHGDHTDPLGIVREAIKLRDKQIERAKRATTERYTQTWVVFDRERQNDPRRKQILQAIDLADANDVKLAISIPSFEFWLLLHFEYTTGAFDGCSAVKKALKKFIKDYEKSDLPLDDLIGRLGLAMTNASRCHTHWNSVGGDRNPSTSVDKLIRELNKSARSDVRLF